MIKILSEQETPEIVLLPEVVAKIKALVGHSDKEIAAHGFVTKVKNAYIVTDIAVFPQWVTATNVENNDDEYVKWINTLSDEQVNTMRFHVHSHVNMPPNPSATDQINFESLVKTCNDFYIYMIMNKKHDFTLFFYDIAKNLIYDKDSLKITYIVDGHPSKEWYENATKSLITTKQLTFPNTTLHNYKPWGYWDDETWQPPPKQTYSGTPKKKGKKK